MKSGLSAAVLLLAGGIVYGYAHLRVQHISMLLGVQQGAVAAVARVGEQKAIKPAGQVLVVMIERCALMRVKCRNQPSQGDT